MKLTESTEMLKEAERQGAVKIMIPVSELKFMLQQASKVEEMQKTLEWYADPENHKKQWTKASDNDWYSSFETDEGERARQALKGESE